MTDVTYYYSTLLAGTVQDPLGRLTFVTDGIGTHAFSYYPLSQGTAGAGRLSLVNGALTDDDLAYTYDWQDRLNVRKLQTHATPPILQRTDNRTWDSLGRTNTVVNDLGSFTFNYNTSLNRPDSLTAPNGIVSSYAYFNNSTPGARAQRLNSITHSNGGTQYSSHAFDYDSSGRITSWIKQASALTGTQADSSSSYGYNLSDEVTSYVRTQTVAPNTVLEQQSWQYDADGNWDSTGTTSMSTRSYDTGNNTTNSTGNRLVHIGGAGKTVVEGVVNEFSTVQVATGSNAAQTATLVQDPANNNGFRFRAEVPVAQGINTLQITATDQTNLVTTKNYTFSVGAVSQSFTYDNNGNLLTDGARTFTWDAKNRLKSVTVGTTTYFWDYDYRDRRVREYQKIGTGAKSLIKMFIWDGTDLVQERGPTNVPTRTHHFGGFADGSTGATKYQTTTDHLGNIREVIAASGTSPVIGSVVTRYDYTPFQGPMTPVKLAGTNVDATFQTIGRYYHHAASGLELSLYRAYDPVLGRWISEDPLGEEGGLNLYVYVKNGPLGAIDPLGLVDWDMVGSAFQGKLGVGVGVGFKCQVSKLKVDLLHVKGSVGSYLGGNGEYGTYSDFEGSLIRAGFGDYQVGLGKYNKTMIPSGDKGQQRESNGGVCGLTRRGDNIDTKYKSSEWLKLGLGATLGFVEGSVSIDFSLLISGLTQ